jgi:hypothetical protein
MEASQLLELEGLTVEDPRAFTHALNRHAEALERHARELHPALAHQEQARREKHQRQLRQAEVDACLDKLI